MNKFVLNIIKIYKKVISPVLHFFPGRGCRFYPTCSDYTYQAIKKYGLLKGLIRGFKRIIKCNPLNQGGHDPC